MRTFLATLLAATRLILSAVATALWREAIPWFGRAFIWATANSTPAAKEVLEAWREWLLRMDRAKRWRPFTRRIAGWIFLRPTSFLIMGSTVMWLLWILGSWVMWVFGP